MKKVVLDT